MKKGFGLLEITVSIALISVSLFALAATSRIASRAASEAGHRIQAAFLLEEGFEAAATMRDDNWANISNLVLGQTYYLLFSGGKWQTTTAPQIIGNLFTRSIILSQVLRDAQFNIAASGQSDPNSRKIEINVSWPEYGVSRSIKSLTYLANIF
jgi:type II secretory pathway pseudopilin PulG